MLENGFFRMLCPFTVVVLELHLNKEANLHVGKCLSSSLLYVIVELCLSDFQSNSESKFSNISGVKYYIENNNCSNLLNAERVPLSPLRYFHNENKVPFEIGFKIERIGANQFMIMQSSIPVLGDLLQIHLCVYKSNN